MLRILVSCFRNIKYFSVKTKLDTLLLLNKEITKENRIYIRVEFRQSLGMNYVSPFQPEREFKPCKCSQIICCRVHWYSMIPRLSISISNFLKLLNKLYKLNEVKKNIIWFIVITENYRLWNLCEMIIGQLWNYFIIWFSFYNNFRFSIKWYSRGQQVI